MSVSVPFTSMMVSCPRTTPGEPRVDAVRAGGGSRRASAAGTSDSKKRRMRGASIEMNAVSMKRRTTKKIVWIVPARSAREKATTSPTPAAQRSAAVAERVREAGREVDRERARRGAGRAARRRRGIP